MLWMHVCRLRPIFLYTIQHMHETAVLALKPSCCACSGSHFGTPLTFGTAHVART